MRLGLPGHEQLLHFVSSPAWDETQLWSVLGGKADAVGSGNGAGLVVGDMTLPKQGTRSVGVR
jgi:hypothetical protein